MSSELEHSLWQEGAGINSKEQRGVGGVGEQMRDSEAAAGYAESFRGAGFTLITHATASFSVSPLS